MRFFRAILPNLSIALILATVVVVILDVYNPLMGFVSGRPFHVLLGLTCLCALTMALVLYGDYRAGRRRRRRPKH